MTISMIVTAWEYRPTITCYVHIVFQNVCIYKMHTLFWVYICYTKQYSTLLLYSKFTLVVLTGKFIPVSTTSVKFLYNNGIVYFKLFCMAYYIIPINCWYFINGICGLKLQQKAHDHVSCLVIETQACATRI